MPGAPPTTSTVPKSPLWALRRRGLRNSACLDQSMRRAERTSRDQTTAGSPSGLKATSPQQLGPSPVKSPCLSPMKLMVASAWIATPRIRPVSAWSPEGMSMASLGARWALAAAMAWAQWPWTSRSSPVPSRASTMTSVRLGMPWKG